MKRGEESIGQISLFDIYENFYIIPAEARPIEDYLLESVLSGSGFERGKERIYKIVMSSRKSSEKVSAIKKEYGMGGAWYGEKRPNNLYGYCTFYGGKYRLYFYDESEEERTVDFSFNDVYKAIVKQIKLGKYLKPDELIEERKWRYKDCDLSDEDMSIINSDNSLLGDICNSISAGNKPYIYPSIEELGFENSINISKEDGVTDEMYGENLISSYKNGTSKVIYKKIANGRVFCMDKAC